ncbi:MAG: NAD(+)/NADH kinase [Leptospiraceae bacterium]|nr:NAD(+)/NADH kinase [Leptospiraceae bacterium]
MTFDKLIIVTRQTRLNESLKRYNTKSQVKFFIESRGQSFADYELENDNYDRARDLILKSVPGDLRYQVIDRSFLPNFIFGPHDLVLTLGQDGLVVNTAKYLDGQPVLAVNPDPARFDGVLLPFQLADVAQALEQTLDPDANNRLGTREISMGRVDLNDGQHLLAFNDFFIGANSHISARYTINFGAASERHSSSGVIVSTPAGSTGWLSSLYNMARGIQQFQGDPAAWDGQPLEWDQRRLVFVVREPFQSKWSGASLVAGQIEAEKKLIIESHMPEKGVIFSDGIESDYLEFNSGSQATIGLARQVTRLLVPAGWHKPTPGEQPPVPARPPKKAPETGLKRKSSPPVRKRRK